MTPKKGNFSFLRNGTSLKLGLFEYKWMLIIFFFLFFSDVFRKIPQWWDTLDTKYFNGTQLLTMVVSELTKTDCDF